MKTFVFTYDRFNSINTTVMLNRERVRPIVLCHTEEQKNLFIKHKRVIGNDIIVTGKPKGLAYNRNFALDMMGKGEWALFMVDDLYRITEMDRYNRIKHETIDVKMGRSCALWRTRFNYDISVKQFYNRVPECIDKAEKNGIYLVGFSNFNNPLFRKNKWKFNALADGRVWLVKKSNLRFDENVQLVDDVCWCAQNMKHLGGVLINQWILPECKRYTKGAFGSIADRMPQKLRECRYLVKTYPEFIKFADKKGWLPESHVTVRGPKRTLVS